MNAYNILAIILIAAGIWGLAHSQFKYTKDTHDANQGSLVMTAKEKLIFNISVWAGVTSIVVGAAMLLFT